MSVPIFLCQKCVKTLGIRETLAIEIILDKTCMECGRKVDVKRENYFVLDSNLIESYRYTMQNKDSEKDKPCNDCVEQHGEYDICLDCCYNYPSLFRRY